MRTNFAHTSPRGHKVVIPNPSLQAQPGLGRERTSNLQGCSRHSHTCLRFVGVCGSPHVAIPVVSYAAGVLAAMHHGSVVYQTRADRGGDGSEGIKQGDSPLWRGEWPQDSHSHGETITRFLRGLGARGLQAAPPTMQKQPRDKGTTGIPGLS